MSQDRNRVFCLMAQRHPLLEDIRRWVGETCEVVGIEECYARERLGGLIGGVFVRSATHPQQPSRELMIQLQTQGFVVITIDDSAFRARLARAYGAGRQSQPDYHDTPPGI